MRRNKHRYVTANFTEQEQAIVKSLLHKYGSLKPVKDGGKRLRGEKNIAAMKAFNMRTGRQIDPTSWTRFCSRIRGREAENSLTNSDSSNSLARCGKCQEVFSNKTILLKHMRKSHYARSSKKGWLMTRELRPERLPMPCLSRELKSEAASSKGAR